MRLVDSVSWVVALAAFSVCGCQEVAAPTTAPLNLTVTGWDPEAGPPVRLEGVQLCEANTSNCAVTDENGLAAIELPVGYESSYTLEKEGWASYLVGDVIPANGEQYGFEMAVEQVFVEQFDRLMSPWPMRETGTVQLAGAWAGATFELMGATGTAYYVHESGDWRGDLTATTQWGSGGFVEVGAGDLQINLGGTAVGCVAALGWPGVANSIRFPVREGYITVASVTCTLPSAVQHRVRAVEAVPGSIVSTSGPPLEGVEVCLTDTSDCVTTDDNGDARISLPANQEVRYTMSKDGYVPYLIGTVTGSLSGTSPRRVMIREEQMAEISEDLMIPYPWTGGFVQLRAWNVSNDPAAVTGITYDLVGETAKQYYIDEDGYPTLGLTATTRWGIGGFLEVPPGEQQFDIGGTATNCRPGITLPTDAENRIKVPVRTGYITLGNWVGCEVP